MVDKKKIEKVDEVVDKTEVKTTPPSKKQEQKSEKIHMYIGPSLPGGKLKKNTILAGTLEEIHEYHKETLAEFPKVAQLIVPVSKLAQSKAKLKKSGNVLNKYYKDLSQSTPGRKEA